MFRNLHFSNLTPFGELRMYLPPVKDKPRDLAEVHLFTGINGTGKTRLLSALAAMLGEPKSLLKRLKGSEGPCQLRTSDADVTNENKTVSNYPAQFQVTSQNIHPQSANPIMTWLSTVPAFAYAGTPYVSDTNVTLMADVPKPSRASCLEFVRLSDNSTALFQAIANLKLQAAMDSMVDTTDLDYGTVPISHAINTVRQLESTISTITGLPFQFIVTSHPTFNLKVGWGKTKLPIDLLPDGLRSILGWLVHAVAMSDAWSQGKVNALQKETIFLLDEIDCHLHPAWQRRILPAFQRLFPHAQIFVATHSPFLIASLNHGWIHQLTVKSDGSVDVAPPHPASEGDSYITVLEDIMGIKEWYDPETEGLLQEFRTARDVACNGDGTAEEAARTLAEQISKRSPELRYIMGRELSQMNRQLEQRLVK